MFGRDEQHRHPRTGTSRTPCSTPKHPETYMYFPGFALCGVDGVFPSILMFRNPMPSPLPPLFGGWLSPPMSHIADTHPPAWLCSPQPTCPATSEKRVLFLSCSS